MNREGKKYFSYVRVSTEMQVDGYSLEGQENSIKRFAEREEMICAGIYKDAGKSGKSIEGRPDFKRLLLDIQNGAKVDFVIVYKLSRFGRNAADILNSLELIQSYGVELICVEEGIDSSQTSGKLLISVLSAVAEIERENILEQTMNGRREKARQGLWNGGPAPYGYVLKENRLIVSEEEAKIVQMIFDKYVNTKIGYNGIARYLNYQGIRKTANCKAALDSWSGSFVKDVLDNPVYFGKIAYGRRVREKKKGSKYEYITVLADDFILVDGKHEAIVSEEIWNKAHQKRLRTGLKPKSKIGQERKHLLTGLLRCPKCGSLMYCNRHAWTNKDGTYKDVYYYYCGHSDSSRGKVCNYKAKLKKCDIEPLVIEVIKEIVGNEFFVTEIQKRIGKQTDSSVIDRELKNYQQKLKEVEANKFRLEQEIDNMPLDAKYRERKIQDMTTRLESLYETMMDLEGLIKDAQLRKNAIEEDVMTMENIYRLLLSFSQIYDKMDDIEKKNLLSYLIKRIDIYANDEGTTQVLKSIEFNFPIYKDGAFVRKILLDERVNVETLMYPQEILSVQDYNINNGTSFLNLDDHSDIISIAYTSWRFEEDDSLAYIISNTSIRSETSYSEIRYYIKEVAQELSVFKQYELADENIAIDGIEVSFVSEIINQVIYHVDAKFIYEEVYYYLTIDSTDENCLENTVRLLLESAK